MSRKRVWKYTALSLAEVKGVAVTTVRRHIREKRFNPESIKQVAQYLEGRR